MMQLFDAMNVFRVLGDLSHVLTIFGLIYTIHKRKSSSSEISLKTQCLLALVFLVRYAGTMAP
jgi:ER lumen protein retaining receptor